MKAIYTSIFLLACYQSAIAEIGYIFEADLNGDGFEDSIMSGPYGMFGNGGGPFLLSLSKADGTFAKQAIGLHPKAAALEKNGEKSKIWGYWHSSAKSGELGYTMLDGSFKTEYITLYFEPDTDGINRKIYELIFNKNQLIKFKKIENYIPPEYPWGKG